MNFCMLYISGYTFLYFACMCMYDGYIRRLKGSYIQHTCKIQDIYQSILHVSCMYLMFLGVCMCMYVYICCAYDVHIFVFCVILHVFACIFCSQKCQSADITNIQAIHTHTYKYNRDTYKIHAKIHANTCKYIQFTQVRKNAYSGY